MISDKKYVNKNNPCNTMTHVAGIFYVCISKNTAWKIPKKLLLVDSEVDSYGNSNSSTYHRVVTHTEEAHHLYVSRN